MQGRYQPNDSRFRSPNSTVRPPHLGNDFQNVPMHGYGNMHGEPPRFSQDQPRMFSPPNPPFPNIPPGSHQQQAQQNLNFHPNPPFSPSTPRINPQNQSGFSRPPPRIDNLQLQKDFPFQHPVSHIHQQASGDPTQNTSLQGSGLSNSFARNDVPDFLQMQQKQFGNPQWIQHSEEKTQEMQQSNTKGFYPPANYSGTGMSNFPPPTYDSRQFPPNYDIIKNQMLDSQSFVEHQKQFTKDDREKNKKLIITKEASQEWVNRWLGQIGKSSQEQLTKSSSELACSKTLKICEAQERVKQMVFLLAKLKQETAYLESLTVDSDEWKIHAEKATQLQHELKRHQEVMTDEAMLSDLQQRISKRRKKRLRKKEIRRESYEDRQQQMADREETHQRVDNWQARIQKEELNKKQEKELKAAADSILSEVRKKIADVVKTIDLLKGLQKLRKLRKDRLSRQGITVPTGSDLKFEEQTTQQIKVMQSQKEVYLAEEKTLKVMLEVEQEETKEKERERLQKIQKLKAEREERKMNIKMFGPSETIQGDDPLFPYFQYYDQANQTLEAFLQIRRDWDMFLVPDRTPGGTRIPDGFVVPSDPSSEAWATALKDD
ncbi:Programmed cell death protein 7 [Mizuhopecten yessoensis]|uniref:Programmed cell death protein 7 n=2 Tax=Mizuhopecten yessoensis TaxID=6573 RepID=A0A210PRB5_MIZYE|nr:Programmed cell death protein 7 [Mizuhopecten yessoensis]